MDQQTAENWGIFKLTRHEVATKAWNLYLGIPVVTFEQLESGKTYWSRYNDSAYGGRYGVTGEIYRIGKVSPARRKVEAQKLGELAVTNLTLGANKHKEFREYDKNLHDLFLLDEDSYNELIIQASVNGIFIDPKVLEENQHILCVDCPRELDPKVFDYLKTWTVERLQEEIDSHEKRITICKWLINKKNEPK